MSELTDKIRVMFKQGDDIRDAGLTTPEDICRYDDIAYGNHPQQVLDVYRLKSLKDEVLPVIVSIHGGGWVYGDKERYQYYCMSLAQRGFAVVNFTYRLAPETKFPAAVEDTNIVMQWIEDHAQEYKFDTNNVFALGDSAGANICSIYAAIMTNPEYQKMYGYELPSFSLKAIALNCGIYKMDAGNDEMTAGLMKEILAEGGTPEELRKMSGLYFINENYPPVFVMTCSGDLLKVAARQLAEVLEEYNVPFEYHYYASKTKKDLGHVFHCNMKLQEAKICNDEECDFFKKYID